MGCKCCRERVIAKLSHRYPAAGSSAWLGNTVWWADWCLSFIWMWRRRRVAKELRRRWLPMRLDARA